MKNSDLGAHIQATSPVCLYHDEAILEQHLARLEERDYVVYDLDATAWTADDIYDRLLDELDDGRQFRRNVSGLEESLAWIYNVYFRPEWISLPGLAPEFTEPYDDPGPGCIFVVRHIDALFERSPDLVREVLSEFASAAWYWLVDGRRLVTLVLTDRSDPLLGPKLGRLGGNEVCTARSLHLDPPQEGE